MMEGARSLTKGAMVKTGKSRLVRVVGNEVDQGLACLHSAASLNSLRLSRISIEIGLVIISARITEPT
jgi:hypothetical protein